MKLFLFENIVVIVNWEFALIFFRLIDMENRNLA